MSKYAEVRLWDKKVGTVHLDDDSSFAQFKYEPSFVDSGLELSPVMMPLSDKTYCFKELDPEVFHGLPGLLADSLPDRFGSELTTIWIKKLGKTEKDFNIIDRLCYTGKWGMGALEYAPVSDKRAAEEAVNIQRLTDLASIVLANRENLSSVTDICTSRNLNEELSQMIYLGTSAGGARAKAVVAYNPITGEVRTGLKNEDDKGFEDWLIKFSGLQENRDKEKNDDIDFGRIEYAYYKMALDCGIYMSECRLLDDHRNMHFITKRFDRTAGGKKIHMLTLSAMGHYDFNKPGTCGYENVIDILRKINAPDSDFEQEYRRAVFNILARNQDDHVKNTAFIMSRDGKWSLSPAYDVCFAYNPKGYWTGRHQMTLNGKRDDFNLNDLKSCGYYAGLSDERISSIISDIKSVVEDWREYADQAGVRPEKAGQIFKTFPLAGI